MKLTSFDRDGVRVWMEDGVVIREIPLGDGNCKRFHKNGMLECEYQKIGGEIHGTFRQWHDNGKLATEVTYISGVACGIERRWNRDGSLDMETEIISPNACHSKLYHLGKYDDVFLWNGKPMSKTRWLKKIENARLREAKVAQREDGTGTQLDNNGPENGTGPINAR
jgi:hypothetical protein